MMILSRSTVMAKCHIVWGCVMTVIERDEKRSDGPSMQVLLDQETREVPVALRSTSTVAASEADVPVERYTSSAFHDLEVEHVWKRTWQMACREDEVANPGDTHVYEVAGLSVLVVRTADGSLKAYPNACLHRGALLRGESGPVQQLRCPFHGFAWSLEGDLVDVPCRWDFPHVDDAEFSLPEHQVATWQGYAFINMDPAAAPFEDYIGGLAEHVAEIARPGLADRFTAAHVRKVIRCNWKVAMEAFMESYHVATTHPQVLLWGADANTQYDVYEGERHWNRMITASGSPSPHLGPDVPEQDVVDSLFKDFLGFPESPEVPDGVTARQMVAEAFRGVARDAMGYDASAATDSQVLDTIQYFLFPNLMPFIGLLINLSYRFLPYGDDPDMCTMDILMLLPLPAGMPRPPAPPVHLIGPDDSIAEAVELGANAPALAQDMDNVWRVQKGLHATQKPGVTLGLYQESRVRHFHRLLDEYLPT